MPTTTRAPSVARLVSYLGVDAAAARQIRTWIKADNIADRDDLPPLTLAWMRDSYRTPKAKRIALHAIDCLLDNFGIEGSAVKGGGRFNYSNTGDSYAATIGYFDRPATWGGYTETWHLGDWGTLAERGEIF